MHLKIGFPKKKEKKIHVFSLLGKGGHKYIQYPVFVYKIETPVFSSDC